MAALIFRAIAASLLLILAAGCGGGKRNIDTGYQRDPIYRYQPDPPYYGPGYDPFPQQPYEYDPLVRYPNVTRLAPRAPSDLLSQHLAEFAGVFGGNFAELHQQLNFGYQALDHSAYVMASPGVRLTRNPADPARVSLLLQSDVNTVCFVTYGLLSPQARQQVLGVDVTGAGSFGLGDEHGLYVGVRQYGEPRYYWYGPFSTAEDWRAQVARDSSFADGSAAYVTLAVFNGDALRIDGVNVDLGG